MSLTKVPNPTLCINAPSIFLQHGIRAFDSRQGPEETYIEMRPESGVLLQDVNGGTSEGELWTHT